MQTAEPLAFNIWLRCEAYGTTFSRIVTADDITAAVEKYVQDIMSRHSISRRNLTVSLAQPI